jgi:anti-sigma B factor antagonist
MDHTTSEENGAIIITFGGDMVLDSSPDCRKVLLESVAKNMPVLADLSAVTYIDSSGMACMVEALQSARKSGHAFALAGVSDAAMRVLSLERLDSVFSIHGSREADLKSLD